MSAVCSGWCAITDSYTRAACYYRTTRTFCLGFCSCPIPSSAVKTHVWFIAHDGPLSWPIQDAIRRYYAQGVQVSFDKTILLLAKHYNTDSCGLACVWISFVPFHDAYQTDIQEDKFNNIRKNSSPQTKRKSYSGTQFVDISGSSSRSLIQLEDGVKINLFAMLLV